MFNCLFYDDSDSLWDMVRGYIRNHCNVLAHGVDSVDSFVDEGISIADELRPIIEDVWPVANMGQLYDESLTEHLYFKYRQERVKRFYLEGEDSYDTPNSDK